MFLEFFLFLSFLCSVKFGFFVFYFVCWCGLGFWGGIGHVEIETRSHFILVSSYHYENFIGEHFEKCSLCDQQYCSLIVCLVRAVRCMMRVEHFQSSELYFFFSPLQDLENWKKFCTDVSKFIDRILIRLFYSVFLFQCGDTTFQMLFHYLKCSIFLCLSLLMLLSYIPMW